jgi:ATP-dependent DNA helicase RecQ
MTAHGAKGLEFGHVLVMDCADWRWSGEDERRLLYVAMTRARETLTLMRAEGGRNPYFIDLGTVDGVVDLLPTQRPEHRADINRRYVSLGPADVDIGFAGRHRPEDRLHERIAGLSPGDTVIVSGGQVTTNDRQVVGRLASKTDLKTNAAVTGKVSGVLVRTREQTPAEYRASVKVDRWETVLMELVLPAE